MCTNGFSAEIPQESASPCQQIASTFHCPPRRRLPTGSSHWRTGLPPPPQPPCTLAAYPLDRPTTALPSCQCGQLPYLPGKTSLWATLHGPHYLKLTGQGWRQKILIHLSMQLCGLHLRTSCVCRAAAVLALALPSKEPSFTLVMDGQPALTLSSYTAAFTQLLLLIRYNQLHNFGMLGSNNLSFLKLSPVLRSSDRLSALMRTKWFALW